MADPKNEKYTSWSRQRRFQAAVKKVVHDGWSQVEACAEFGVSRSQLNVKCREYRRDYEERIEKLKAGAGGPAPTSATPGLKPLGLNERRRVPATFQEFDDYYWSNWGCPDCDGAHHERKPFHNEVVDALTGDHRRVVVNIPPFHAKSTYGTVKATVYELCKNPNQRTIIISKSSRFAETFLVSINELLTNPELYVPGRNLINDFGPFKPEGAQSIWNRSQIYVAGRSSAEKDPTVQVLGVGNQIYGRRADKIRCDDIADVDNQRNPDQVMKMLEWLDKMVSSRIGKSGQLTYIGTRVHAGDIYSELKRRAGYKVITYSCITDDENELTLWPEHFPYSQAMLARNELSPADFQLIYQNVDIPGLSASFPPEIVEQCKDPDRMLGHYDSSWRLVAGLDPAGGNKTSGYTAFTLLGIDLRTGKRFLIDQTAVKSMRAPQIRDQIFDWTERYPIYEWRVESNGLQSQLVQYNEEVINFLARRGVRVVPHFTHSNKWDPQFGVESTGPLFHAELISIPWGHASAAQAFQPFIDQLIQFPMGQVTDRVMSFWFADLGCREFLKRAHLPLFNQRMHVPSRVRRRRHLVDFYSQEVRNVPVEEQRRGVMFGTRPGGGRETVGRPDRWGNFEEQAPEEPQRFVNVPRMVNPASRVVSR